ncbi:hypothetical protein ABEB36_015119 [Hypothenemus hampei]|uniref:Uncharacterized protein n=1 Tax=Hypothenemus hampei TaxID=57062 RepID=A0ABD1E1D1_HYPHA
MSAPDDPGGDESEDNDWNSIIEADTRSPDENAVKKSSREVSLYKNDAPGPYIVFLESSDVEDSRIGDYSHFKIARDLFQLKLENIKKYEVKGSNRLSVELNSAKSANEFCANKHLLSKGYLSYIPFNRLFCKGVIRGIPDFLLLTEISQAISSSFSVDSITRLNRSNIDPVSKEVTIYRSGPDTSPNPLDFPSFQRVKDKEILPMAPCLLNLRRVKTSMIGDLLLFENLWESARLHRWLETPLGKKPGTRTSHNDALLNPNGRTPRFYVFEEESQDSTSNIIINSDYAEGSETHYQPMSSRAPPPSQSSSTFQLNMLATLGPQILYSLKQTRRPKCLRELVIINTSKQARGQIDRTSPVKG